MKYSILMPYHKRYDLLHNTLVSFEHHYGHRTDWEVLLGVDEKTWAVPTESNALDNVIKSFPNININQVDVKGYPNTSNPSAAYNLCAKEATGEYFVLTNPECLHCVNIIDALDTIFSKAPEVYVVCGCESAEYCETVKIKKLSEFAYTHGSWYQHSEFRNACYHFCTSTSNENFHRIGGFDERFMHGVAYDDDDFIDKIRHYNIPIVVRDDLLSIHQYHTPTGLLSANVELAEKNRALFLSNKQERKIKGNSSGND